MKQCRLDHMTSEITVIPERRVMENSRKEKQEIERDSEYSVDAEPAEFELLKAEISREHDRYLRILADFDNYRRRVERERAVSAHAGKRELILPLLEVLDDFDRAMEHLGDVPEWASSGFEAIYKRLNGILQSQGIVSYESVGDSFDPVRHEAVGLAEDQDVEPGTVVAELNRGYCWGAEVLRPARVRVAL
jgi:molecular chaperone GrpE